MAGTTDFTNVTLTSVEVIAGTSGTDVLTHSEHFWDLRGTTASGIEAVLTTAHVVVMRVGDIPTALLIDTLVPSTLTVDASSLTLTTEQRAPMFAHGVDTASFYSYTSQYEGLQKLWERYEANRLVVIGVPSNDFGNQEPESEAKIKEFCQGAFGITFPLTATYAVAGAKAHPLCSWVFQKLGSGAAPRWNFHKVLIGGDGNAIAAYGSSTTPQSSTLMSEIERTLAC